MRNDCVEIKAIQKNILNLKEVLTYKDLILLLAGRDISVKYKQTSLGIGWALIKPIATMLILTLVFEKIAGLKSTEGTPYPLLILAGMVPWMCFAGALSDMSNSVVSSSNLVSKIYFPRLIIPIASIGSAALDFLIGLSFLVVATAIFGNGLTWRVLLLPVFIILLFLSIVGPGLIFSALSVKYRDVGYILPFAIQFGMYITPVGYSTEILSGKMKLILGANPIAFVIDGFRWSLSIDTSFPSVIQTLVNVSVIMIGVYVGLEVFKRNERNFADKI